MINNKIYLFDPSFSEEGHYKRFSKHYLNLFISLYTDFQIIYLDNGQFSKSSNQELHKNIKIIDNLNINVENKLIEYSLIKKIFFILGLYFDYKNIFKQINENDHVVFLSQGNLMLWLYLLFHKKSYSVALISIRRIYRINILDFILKPIFTNFLKFSKNVIVTDDFYVDRVNKYCNNIFSIPDRVLIDNINYQINKYNKKNEIINLLSLGTISELKNPLDFIKELKNIKDIKINYKIVGKSLGKIKERIIQEILNFEEYKNISIEYIDEYLDEKSYTECLNEADLLVISYKMKYLERMTSGVFWDALQLKKAVLVENNHYFMSYLSKYDVGYGYDNGDLYNTLLEFKRNRNKIICFDQVCKDFSFNVIKKKFKMNFYV